MSIKYGSYDPPQRVEGPITDTYDDNDWLLIWNLDESGTIYSISRPTTVSKDAPGCNSYTYTQLTSYKSGSWTQIMFTSLFHPHIKWVFDLSSNSTNLPLVLQAIMIDGNPANYMTTNTNYPVSLNWDLSTSLNPTTTYSFMHNNNGSEPGDIPTLGVSDGVVWGTGMFWGQIDAYTNYGGLLNTQIPHIGSGGGSTGDRLLVYVR